MRLLFLALALSLLTTTSFAGEGQLTVAKIPEQLLKGADVVKRFEEVKYELFSLTETVINKKYAITVLNEQGERNATLVEYYDKLRAIKSISGVLYDANGNVLKRVKSKDIQDVSNNDGSDLASDGRLKIHNFYHKVFPYTVEYEIEIRYNHTYYIDPWVPQEDDKYSVESSRFTVVVPENYDLRFRSFNYKGEPVVSKTKGKKTMEWQVKNLNAIEQPFAAPLWRELTTCVFLAPTEFEIQGYKGNMSSWEELGKFQLALNKDRDKLPETVVQKVKELTAGIHDDNEKVKILYNYLQKNTRYISIQLGIGGWQPFEASSVAQKGYGDCKALSNYMYSLLRAAGIKSHYTVIRAGNSKNDRMIIEDFPSKQANHVILCVPLAKDTMWLECTNQTVPAGYMGSFTGNRKALVITENGGKLVSTPNYFLKDNLQLRSIKGKINETGDLTATIGTQFTGIQQDQLQGMINNLSKEKVKKVLNEELLDLSTYDIIDFKYQEKKDVLPQIDEHLDLFVSKFATISGKRLFITPNLLNKSTTKPNTDDRIYDFVFDVEYRDVDSVEIEIPAGYVLESVPQPVALKTKFGAYSSNIRLAGNKVYYVRTREQYAGRFPAKDAPEVAKFYEAIYKADRGRVVLVKDQTSSPPSP